MTDEKQLQENYDWARSRYHTEYNAYLAFYKIKDCLSQAKGDSVLDLACGDGTLTAMLRKRFKRIVGLDASSKHLAEARLKVPEAEFVESLIEDYKCDERFGTVLMLEILEHVVDPVAVLRKAATFLEPGGVLIVHVPNAHAVNRKIAVLMGTLKNCEELSPFDLQVAGHRRSYTMESLRTDIAKANLRVLEMGGIFYKTLSTAQMDWFLKNGLWQDGGFGWGRVGEEQTKNWKDEFCRACYEFGKERPEDCNLLYAVISRDQK